jgi:hypothetical protein
MKLELIVSQWFCHQNADVVKTTTKAEQSAKVKD